MKKMMRKLLFVCASIVLLAGCRFNNKNKIDDNPISVEENLFTITGEICSINKTADSNLAERTALPVVNINETGIVYTVSAVEVLTSSFSSTSSKKYECKISGTSFTVRLPAGTYSFEAVGKKNLGTESAPNWQTMLRGNKSVTVNTDGTLSAGGSTLSIPVAPIQSAEGTGKARLRIRYSDSGSVTLNVVRVVWVDENNLQKHQDIVLNPNTDYWFSFDTDNPTNQSTAPAVSSMKNVASGSYTVQFYFWYKNGFSSTDDIETNIGVKPESWADGEVKYCCSEVINIYDNYVTEKWINTGNSEYFTTDGSDVVMCITQACLENFGRSKFVSYNGDDNNTGALTKPYRSIAKAVDSLSSRNGDVIIYLLSDIVENGAGSKVTIAPDSTNLNLQIQSFGMNQWTENGVTKCEPYCVDLNDKWFELGNSITQINPLKIKDLKIIGGKSNSNDEGIFLDPNGFCKISSVVFGGYIIVDGNKTYANDASVKPMKRNLYLKDGAKIKIFDALDERSKIGVSLDHLISNNPEQITAGYNSAYAGTGAIAADPSSIFFSDSEDALCGWNSSKTEVVMAVSKGAVEPMQIQDVVITFPYEWQQLTVSGGYATRPAMNIKLCDSNGQELTPGSGSELYYKIWCTKKGDKTSLENAPNGHANGTTYTTGGIEFTPSSASNVLPQDYAGVYTVTVSVMYKKDSTSAISPLLASKDFTYWYEGTGKPLSLYAREQEAVETPLAPAENTTLSIYTKKDMEVLRDIVNGHWKPKGTVIQSIFDNVTVNLMTDVSLDNEDWEPIGESDIAANGYNGPYFAGTFNGNNHTINDFRLPLTYKYNGLFGYCKGLIQNLTLIVNTKTSDGSLAECSKEYVGGIAGYLNIYNANSGICNCKVNGKIELKATRPKSSVNGYTNYMYIGGFVGYNQGTTESGMPDGYTVEQYKGRFTSCENYAELNITTKNETTGESIWVPVYVGGIMGNNSGIIDNCINYAKMLTTEDGNDTEKVNPVVFVAGIAGTGASIFNCYNYGLIKQTNGNNASLAGIVGRSGSGGSIHNCENYGNIISEQYPDSVYTYIDNSIYAAGIVAYYISSSKNFENCVNYGDVYNKGNCTGGIVGQQSVSDAGAGFKSLKNTGKITGHKNVGGIAGYTEGSSSIFTDCINYGEVSPVVTLEDNGVINSCDCIGGIIGYAKLAKIESCINNAKVTGSHYVGGIVGRCGTSPFYCVNSINTGAVTGKNFVGGISGTMQPVNSAFSIYLYNCLNSGAVEQKGTDGTNIKLYAAGIFNDMSVNNSSVSKIYNCVNTGSVTSKQFAAGIANVNKKGRSYNKYYDENSSVKNCYYLSGVVRANDGTNDGPGFYSTYNNTGNDENPASMTEMFIPGGDTLVMLDKVDTFLNKYYIEDSEIKYRYVSPMYGAGPLNCDDVVGCLNNFVDNTTITGYTLKHWYYNSNNELDFIPESESITPVVGKKGFVLCEKGSTSTNDITVDNSFYICTHEVTQAEYKAVMGNNPSYFSSNPAEGEVQENRPVENVSWFDALVYCNKRSVEAGLTPYYKVDGKTDVNTWYNTELTPSVYSPHHGETISGTITTDESANGFRLPTVSEWKYAASGGKDATPYTYSGSGTLSEVGWYTSNSGSKTHEVMKCTKANSLGLYDMSGNVLEWCWDSSGSSRIMFGGFWNSNESGCAITTSNYSNSPSERQGQTQSCGFRVVRNAY